MEQQFKEVETLHSFTATLNDTVSGIYEPTRFADLLIEKSLVPEPAARDILSLLGTSDYDKVSRLVFVVCSTLKSAASQERAVEIFDGLVMILYHGLELKDLAEQIMEYHCEYEVPVGESCPF